MTMSGEHDNNNSSNTNNHNNTDNDINNSKQEDDNDDDSDDDDNDDNDDELLVLLASDFAPKQGYKHTHKHFNVEEPKDQSSCCCNSDDSDNDNDNATVETFSSSTNSLFSVGSFSNSGCDLSCSTSCLFFPDEKPVTKRQVTFGSKIQVQEYAITLGVHPCNSDGLALTLDWAHGEEYTIITRDGYEHPHRTAKYCMPRRLSFLERRNKLFEASAGERNAELDRAMQLLQASFVPILPPLLVALDEVEDEQEPQNDNDNDEFYFPLNRKANRRKAQQPAAAESLMVVEWQRMN